MKSANGAADHNATDMVTGVKVERFMALGDILTSRKSDQRRLKRRKEQTSGVKAQTKYVFHAIELLQTEGFDTYGIRDRKDQNVKEFKIARGYRIPEKFRRLPRGWARRPYRGEMYWRKYIRRYMRILYGWFKEGSDNSEMKQGPSIMVENLRKRYPNTYTLPSFTEVNH